MENFKQNRTPEYTILTIGLVLAFTIAGWFVAQGLKEFSNGSRTVNVKGLAAMEVNADKVTWPLVYKELSNNLNTLYNNLESKNSIVVKFLTDRGIKREDITISAPTVIDLLANQYNSQPVQERYNATSVIIVTTNEVEKVRSIIEQQSELLKDGIAIVRDEYRYRTEYDFTGLNDIKPQMIEDATSNARAAAEKFAEDSKSKLGKIKRAYQGQFSITDRDAYTPEIKSVRVVTTIDYFLED